MPTIKRSKYLLTTSLIHELISNTTYVNEKFLWCTKLSWTKTIIEMLELISNTTYVSETFLWCTKLSWTKTITEMESGT